MYDRNREQLAWAAGFIEGEGHFGCSFSNTSISNGQRKRPKLIVTAGQVQLEPLTRLVAYLNIGKILGPYQHDRKQPFYVWAAGGFENVQAIAALLWPWLSPKRKQQIRIALERFHANYWPPISQAETSRRCWEARRRNGTISGAARSGWHFKRNGRRGPKKLEAESSNLGT